MLKSRLLGAAGIVAVVGAVVVGMVSAQTPASPAFEAASVKPNKSGNAQKGIGPEPGGRFSAINVSLQELIPFAYGIAQLSASTRIVGGPAWVSSDRFDIVAKAEGTPSPEQMRTLVRALLADRFKLSAHNELRDIPVYALMIARGDKVFGPQLRRSSVDCAALYAVARATPQPPAEVQAAIQNSCSKRFRPGNVTGGGWTMGGFANTLEPFVSRIVVDKTGLAGDFDITLEWTPESASAASDNLAPPSGPATDLPSIFTALQEQLGLKLESTTGPVDVLVIDHVEPPTPD
jgi:uncharacterized protein (TIGR03435 family)